MAQMDRQTREKPSWKQRALEIEYWIMTLLVLGAFGAGIVAAISAL